MALSEQVLRAAAVASWQNSESFSVEAKLLAEHQYGARAVALAILGLEEFAKAIAYTVAALSGEPDDVLVKRLNHLTSHEVKHLIAQSAEYAQIVTEEWIDIMAGETGHWPSPEQRLADQLAHVARRGLGDLLDKGEALAFFKTLRKMPTSFPGDDPDLLVEPDRKNAALYVGLTPDGLLKTPIRIASEAASQIAGLDWFLEQYAGLPAVLQDDAEWTRFAARARS
jgi:AbiV family abortive infection protein